MISEQTSDSSDPPLIVLRKGKGNCWSSTRTQPLCEVLVSQNSGFGYHLLLFYQFSVFIQNPWAISYATILGLKNNDFERSGAGHHISFQNSGYD